MTVKLLEYDPALRGVIQNAHPFIYLANRRARAALTCLECGACAEIGPDKRLNVNLFDSRSLTLKNEVEHLPVFNSERFPHLHTGSRDPARCIALNSCRKNLSKILLAAPTKPLRFVGLQVAHNGQKLLRLPQVDLVDTQRPYRLSGPGGSTLQIPLFDRARCPPPT
jgi:ferredoxin